MAKRKSGKNYRLNFGGTRKKLYAATLKAAVADAKYWVSFGQKQVCIDKMLPSGRGKQIRCLKRR